MMKLYSSNLALASRFAIALLMLFAALGQANAQCDQTIVSDTIVSTYNGNPVDICVDLDYVVAIRSDRFVDGVSQTNFPQGCNFDSLIYYPYSTFPGGGAAGPYELVVWSLNGNFFSGTFADIDDLVAQMNAFDPAGNWTNEELTRNIIGGESGQVYDILTIEQPSSGIRRTVNPNIARSARGTIESFDGIGFHEYIVNDPNTGCRDTLVVFLEPNIQDDNIDVFTDFNTESDVICLDNSQLIGALQAATICDDPDNGTLNDQGGYCYTYTPNAGHIGSDFVCIEVCDNTPTPIGPLCKRTRINFITETPANLPTDTVRFQMTNTDTTVCVNDVLDLGGMPDGVSLCGPVPAGMTIVPNVNGCVDISPSASFSGPAIVCVRHCLGPICDTTILDFTVLDDCDLAVFDTNAETVASQGNPTSYCLPVDPVVLGTYTLNVDGQVYNGDLGECDIVQQTFYNYAPLFGNGSAGPYTLTSWIVDGVTFSTTFQDPAALLAFMRSSDPDGDWRLDATSFNIFGGDASANYAFMDIVHNATGSLSNLQPNPIDIARGTTIDLPGDGVYEIELSDANTGCSDLIVVTIGQAPQTTSDTINVTVFQNRPSQSTCLFPNPRDAFSLCGDVSNGTTTFDLNNCVVYSPDLNFLGSDTLCAISCDLPGGTVCDTTVVIFSVFPRPPNSTTTLTIDVTVFADSVSETTCLFTVPRDEFSVCDDVNNGTTTFDANDCVVYRPNPGFVGMDTLCTVSCDLPAGTVCDTTFVIFSVVAAPPPPPEPDTITLANFGDAPFNLCNGLPITGPFSSVSICGTSGPFTASLSLDEQCVVADPTDGVAGTGEICVTFCSTETPPVCQEILFIISLTPS